jgi:hypothetical protein
VPRAPLASLNLAAFAYTFKTDVGPTPGAGQIQLNNADPTLATEMYIHELDSNGSDIALFLEYLTPGSWCNLGNRGDYQGQHTSWDVTAPTVDNGAIWTVPLTLFESVGGSFSNNEKVNLVLRYTSSGDFEGEHVLTGDPENPPAELDLGQLLWDGGEGGVPGPKAWIDIALISPWTNLGSSTQDAQYRLVGDMVQLRGKIKGGTTGSRAFALPEGFRPPTNLTIPATYYWYPQGGGGTPDAATLLVIDNGAVEVFFPDTGNANDVGFSCQFSVTP